MEATYRLNQPQVACEELAGDLMLLHFGSGLYYNLRGTGADVCAFLLAGGTLNAATAALVRRFGMNAQQIAQDLTSFVTRLITEDLLVAAERSRTSEPMRITATAYEPPQFQKYDDMADQLLLDKIDDQSPQAQDPFQP